MTLEKIITQAIDLHVHIGPEIIPRKFTAQSLATTEEGRLAGAVAKNHSYPTAGMFDTNTIDGFELYGSIVLNNSVGGLNSEAVYAASLASRRPLVVWLPTINSEQFLLKNKYEIAPEWVEDKGLTLKASQDVSPVRVTSNGQLLPETKQVIDMIAQVGGVLATGHIASEESLLVAQYARQNDIPVIITHPIYQHIAMPIDVQKKLAKQGCFLEQPYSMYSMDGISIKAITDQIKAVGPESVVLSSDVGQIFSPSPSEALLQYAKLLVKEGIPLQWIQTMMVDNPRKILKNRTRE